MRKQYDGLYALVVSELKADPLSGYLFLFTNRRRTLAAATARITVHLVAYLTRDVVPRGAGCGLGDQVADLVSSGHRKVLRG